MENIGAFDYRKRTNTEVGPGELKSPYAFVSREIESISAPSILDSQFDSLFDKLDLCKREEDRDALVSLMGTLVGECVNQEAVSEQGGNLDIRGPVRGLALMQGFLERQLIKRGSSMANLFRNPRFLSSVNVEADFAHAEKINEKLRGAESVHDFVESLSKQKKVIFIGSEVNLDTRHAIDLVVGITDDPDSKDPVIDEIVIVQVKTAKPDDSTIASILAQHESYANALRELEARGVGEKRAILSKEDGTLDGEAYKAQVESLNSFYVKIILASGTFDNTWDSFVEAAEKCSCDPVLMYTRIRRIDEMAMSGMKQFQINALLLIKKKAEAVGVPQEIFAKYNRLTRGNGHISTAKRITSMITAGREIVSKKRIL